MSGSTPSSTTLICHAPYRNAMPRAEETQTNNRQSASRQTTARGKELDICIYIYSKKLLLYILERESVCGLTCHDGDTVLHLTA